MDDGYVIFKNKEDAIECEKLLLEETKKLNIILNPKKIKICKINRSFIYIKKRFFLNDKGYSIMRLNRNNIFKHRKRINKLFGLMEQKKIHLEDIELSHKSWYGQVKKYKNKKSVYNIDLQIRRLINGYNSNLSSDKCGIRKS